MFVSTQVHLGFQHFNQKLVHRDVSFLRIQEFNAKCYLYCIILDLQTCTCLILAQNILIIVSTCLKHGSSSRSFSSLSFVLPDLVRDRGHVIYSRYTAIQQICSRYTDIQSTVDIQQTCRCLVAPHAVDDVMQRGEESLLQSLYGSLVLQLAVAVRQNNSLT